MYVWGKSLSQFSMQEAKLSSNTYEISGVLQQDLHAKTQKFKNWN